MDTKGFEGGGVFVRPEPEIPDSKMLGVPLPDLAMTEPVRRGGFVPLDERVHQDRSGEFGSDRDVFGSRFD